MDGYNFQQNFTKKLQTNKYLGPEKTIREIICKQKENIQFGKKHPVKRLNN